MTFQEMDDMLLVLYLGRRADATPERRIVFLNEAQNDLALTFFFDELETVNRTLISVSGTARYPFPTNDVHITSLRDITNGHPLEERDWQWYNDNDAFEDASVAVTGIPNYWIIHDLGLYLSACPNGAFTYRSTGRRYPVAVGPSQNCVLPEDWHLIVVQKAASDFLSAVGNSVRAQDIKNEWLAKIAGKQEKRTLRRRQTSAQLVVQSIKPGRSSRRGSTEE